MMCAFALLAVLRCADLVPMLPAPPLPYAGQPSEPTTNRRGRRRAAKLGLLA